MGVPAKRSHRRGAVDPGASYPYKPTGLSQLATLLNFSGDTASEAVAILVGAQKARRERRYPAQAIERFNRLAQDAPVRLYLEAERDGTLRRMWKVGNTGSGLRGLFVRELWEVLGTPGAIDLFKRCRVCRKWFFDETRNHSKERCSVACTNRWWHRARRRRVGHIAG